MYHAFARSSHFLRHLVTPYTFWFLCPSFFASSSNIFAPAALLASSSNFRITCMYYVLSSAHCPPPSPSSAFPVTTIYIYVGMHIYCNAVSHNYSHNFVHWLISGSSADNSQSALLHNYSDFFIFRSSLSGTNLRFHPPLTSALNFPWLGLHAHLLSLAGTSCPSTFGRTGLTLPIPTITLGSTHAQWQHGVEYLLLPLTQFSLLLKCYILQMYTWIYFYIRPVCSLY